MLRLPVVDRRFRHALARDVFYSPLARLADNAALERILVQVQMHLIRAQFRSILRSVDRRRHRDYNKIAEAVFDGNPSLAERAAKSHLGRSIAAMRNFAEKSAR
ncbi:FCD domain-containing protein [Erythrobacter westpacificensis]|uniref:FCD domain-containing protein n=1 Tax=Erythrobacter westpacificensis TaxID=1055231 RepID=UPI0031F82F60